MSSQASYTAASSQQLAAELRLTDLKVVFGGHSFIRRLKQYTTNYPLTISNPIFCCGGGWKLPKLTQALKNLPDTTFRDSTIYLEIGTNDLCSPNCNPQDLAADICCLCRDVLARGAVFVVIGEPLPRFGPALAKLGDRTPSFADAVKILGRSLRSFTQSMTNVKVWEHRRIAPSLSISVASFIVPDRFDKDGVHLSKCRQRCDKCSCGMKRYLVSVRGALLHAAAYAW